MNVFDLQAKLGIDTSGYTKGLSNAQSAAKMFAKVGVAAFAMVGTATAAVGTTIIKETGNIATYGDSIDKMSQKMGISAEAYQEWDAVLQHSGTSIESLKMSMRTLSLQAQNNAEEFQKLGISEQEVANLSKEELFNKVISGLQRMNESTERTMIASKLFGRGATELGALLNTSAEDTQKMKDRVHELGGVMSDDAVKAAAAYQDQLQDMQTAIQGLKRNVLSDLIPTMTKAMSGITEIASGNYTEGINQFTDGITEVVGKISDIIPKILSEIPNILKKIGNSLLANIGVLVPYISKTLSKIIGVISQLLPTVIDTAVQLAQALIQALIEAIPIVVEAIPDIIKSVLEGVISIVSVLPEWFDVMLKVIETVSEMLIDLAPIIIESALNVYEKVIDFITTPENLAKLIVLAVKIIANLSAALLASVPKLLVGISRIYAAVFDNIVTTDWSEVGRKLLENVTEALQKASNKLAEWWEDWAKSIGEYAVIGWNSVVDTWSGVGRWFGDRVNDIKSAFSRIGDWFRNTFTNAWDNVKKAFSGVASFFGNIWSIIKEKFTNVGTMIGNAIGDTFKLAINAVILTIENALNKIPNTVNSALGTINKIPGVNLSMMSVISLPRLAQGGVLRKGQVGFLEGDGDEAVVPLSQNTEWIDRLASKLNDSGNRTPIQINLYIDNFNNSSDDDIDALTQKIAKSLSRQMNNERAVFA